MRLKKLCIKNIRSYEQQEIDFPEGSLLLAGDVGSGKTSFLLAIEYALFGLQPGQKGAALLRSNAASGEVTLECEIDGREIIIERKLKRDQKSVVNDYAAITIDGEASECSITELKLKILGLMNYPPEFIKKNNLLYRYTVYTPQEQMKQIILEDPETRLNILRHVFGIDKYKRVRENLTITINRFKEDAKVLQGELKTLDYDRIRRESMLLRINEIAKKIEEKEKSFRWRNEARLEIESSLHELENKIKEKKELEKVIEKTKIIIASKQEQLSGLSREHIEITKTLAEEKEVFGEGAYQTCLQQRAELQKLADELQNKKIELGIKMSELGRAKTEYAEKKERIFAMKFCPSCLQDVPAAHKHNIVNETEGKIAALSKEHSLFEREYGFVITELAKMRDALKNAEDKKIHLEILKTKAEYINKARQKSEEISKVKEALQKDIIFLEKHLGSLKSDVLNFIKFENQHSKREEELRGAYHAEKQEEIALAEFKKEMELTQNEIASVQEVISLKEAKAKKLAELNSITEWLSHQFVNLLNFTEIQVLMRLRREFSRLFSTWFFMVGGDSFSVQLDENFTPIIMQGDVEMDYNFLSGGERTAVALAYRLALNQTINSVLSQIKTRDLVILDEPTDGFSEAQIDKMRDVLEQLNVAQLIIVSHEQKIESFVDNIIRLKKEAGVSYIDYTTKPSAPKNLNTPPSSIE